MLVGFVLVDSLLVSHAVFVSNLLIAAAVISCRRLRFCRRLLVDDLLGFSIDILIGNFKLLAGDVPAGDAVQKTGLHLVDAVQL